MKNGPTHHKVPFGDWLEAMAEIFKELGVEATDENIQGAIQQSGAKLMQNKEGTFVMIPVKTK